MLKIEEYVSNLKESKTLSNDYKIDTQQSYISNTQFQNPVYKMAPLEHFQSITENKYSNIFSSYMQSPKNDELKQTPKKRTFSFAESQIIKYPQEEKCNISAEFGSKPPSTCGFRSQQRITETQVKTKEPQKLSQKESIKKLELKTEPQLYSIQKKQTTTTTNRPTSSSLYQTNEFEQIFKDCQSNFEKNKTLKTEEYVACNIF